jgi:hypothetical protein
MIRYTSHAAIDRVQIDSRLFPSGFYRIQKAIDRRTLARLERLARRMEPALREGFLAAIRSARQEITLQLVEQALRAVDPAAAIRAATGNLEFGGMRETLAQIVEASGAITTQALQRTTGNLIASFDLTNPYAAVYARTSVGRLISGITQTTQEGIQRLIERGIMEGIDVRTTARQIRNMVGLTGQQADWVMNYEMRLLDRGIGDIEGKVERYANKLIRQRALSISRSESLDAMNSGQQAAWRAAQDQGYLDKDVTQTWIVARDSRLCEFCAPMPMMKENQAVKIGEYFTGGDGTMVTGPPLHPQCRCAVALKFQ